MTGHRRPWIVRKNRAARRLSVRSVRRRDVILRIFKDKMYEIVSTSFWRLYHDDALVLHVPDTTSMEAGSEFYDLDFG